MKIDGLSALRIAETLNATGVLSPMAYKRDRGIPHPTGGFADVRETKLRDDALCGKADRLRWMEHFRKFEGLTELDRRTVVNIIQSIRIVSKTELAITFLFQMEYDKALELLRLEVA